MIGVSRVGTGDVVRLNVGGRRFVLSKRLLCEKSAFFESLVDEVDRGVLDFNKDDACVQHIHFSHFSIHCHAFIIFFSDFMSDSSCASFRECFPCFFFCCLPNSNYDGVSGLSCFLTVDTLWLTGVGCCLST